MSFLDDILDNAIKEKENGIIEQRLREGAHSLENQVVNDVLERVKKQIAAQVKEAGVSGKWRIKIQGYLSTRGGFWVDSYQWYFTERGGNIDADYINTSLDIAFRELGLTNYKIRVPCDKIRPNGDSVFSRKPKKARCTVWISINMKIPH